MINTSGTGTKYGLSVRRRLYAAFGAVVAVAGVVIVVGVQGVSRLHDNQTLVSRRSVPYLTGLSDAALAAKSAATDERGYLMTGNAVFRTEAIGRRVAEQAGLTQAGAAAVGAEQVGAVAQIRTDLASFNQRLTREFALYATNRPQAVTVSFGTNRNLRKTYESRFAVAMDTAKANTARAAAVSDQQASILRNQLLVLLGLTVMLGGVAAWLLARVVDRPLAATVKVLETAASGDLTVRAAMSGAPEFRRMAQATNKMLAATAGALQEISTSAQLLKDTAAQLASSSETTAQAVTGAAQQADSVSDAAQQVSSNVRTVSTAAKEISATIGQISNSASDAVHVAAEAVDAAHATETAVSKLDISSMEIGAVVKTIATIAEQTNLLALNATIEAARAGDAGKGFAVVAGEVKDLAQETARATGDIAQRVETIQADTRQAIEAISRITEVIAEINVHQTTIASTVEEQSATTDEMTQSLHNTANGTQEIAKNVGAVATTVRATLTHTEQTEETAKQLADMSTALRGLVDRFRY